MSTSALSAAAAGAAAVISLATLIVTTVVTGRREQQKWVRGALTDAFVAFLDASWRGTDALKKRQEEVSAQAYADMRSNLTRLRLLASAPVVAAGEELLGSQRAAMTAEEGKAKAALEQCSTDRRKVVEAGKQEMGLG